MGTEVADFRQWLALKEDRKADDPLATFRCSSEGQELVARHFADGNEVFAHAAERAGKSLIVAALLAASTLGRSHILDRKGLPILLPVLKPPVRAVMGFDSYKLGGAAEIPALCGLLGREGKDYRLHRNGGYVDRIEVRHAKARSESEWSEILVFPYDGVRPRSMELDVWGCFELPPVPYLEALQSRLGTRRRARGLIGATGLEPAQWRPVRDMYPEREREVVDGRVRIRWSVLDNDALPQSVKDELVRRAKTSAYFRAKIHGHLMSAAGQCPFDPEALEAQLAECVKGDMFGVFKESYSPFEDDLRVTWTLKPHRQGNVEVWVPNPSGAIYVASDPSSGTRDPDLPDDRQTRNPACINVVQVNDRCIEGEQVARFMGYVNPAELGIMSRAICEKVSRETGEEPLWIPEVNGGWGDEMIRAFGDDYSNIYQEVRVSSTTGKARKTLGWTQTASRRGALFAALQRGLSEGLMLHSAETVRNLQEVEFDKDDRLDQGSGTGRHAEDAITLGMICYAMSRPREEAWKKPAVTNRQRLEKLAGIEHAENGNGDNGTHDRWPRRFGA